MYCESQQVCKAIKHGDRVTWTICIQCMRVRNFFWMWDDLLEEWSNDSHQEGDGTWGLDWCAGLCNASFPTDSWMWGWWKWGLQRQTIGEDECMPCITLPEGPNHVAGGDRIFLVCRLLLILCHKVMSHVGHIWGCLDKKVDMWSWERNRA